MMASGASSLESTGSNGGTLQQMFTTSKDRSITSNSLSMNDCDMLKQQHDKVVEELNTVRRQQTEANRRCDHAMKELEYYRGQHRAVMNQLESAAQETVNLRSKYNNLVSEKQRTERQVQQLQEEVSSLHADTLIFESSNGDTSTVPLRKYDGIKNQYESLRKRYDDLMEIHKSVENKMEQAVDDNIILKKQVDDISQERNNAVRDRNSVKQQYTAAIRELDMAIRQRNEYKEALSKITGQYEEAIKEINQAMVVRMKASKDLKRLTEERNATVQEYALIMSERDNVHREMEKLSDDLSQSRKKTKDLETQCQEIGEQKQTLIYQVETLRREITAALNDRDKALKKCNDLEEKFGDYSSKDENRSSVKSRLEFSQMSGDATNRDVSTKDSDNFHRTQRERENNENIDTANPEIERLRKNIEKLQSELNEATQEAEVSKRRRDWAFSERDKIVLERESIRTLCDRLRKERDRAVSDLAEALRDSDDIKKQRNEASKELKELKERVEAHIEKETRAPPFHSLHNNNRSHGNSIDSDLQEWDTEVVNLDLSNLGSGDLGFDVAGGRSDPRFPKESAIFVSNIVEGSIAEGKLKLYDCIARVNNMDCSSASRRNVVEALRNSGSHCTLLIKRRRMHTRCIYTIQFPVTNNMEHGLSLESGVYISKIAPGSQAAKEGSLAVGDRILSINNTTIDGIRNPSDVMHILNDMHYDMLTITTLKHMSLSSIMNTPIREINPYFREKPPYLQRMVNSCSQTDDHKKHLGFEQPITQPDRHFEVAHNEVYNKNSSGKGADKSGHNAGPWEMIREKFDAVRGRRHSKDRQRNEKNKYRNSSPNALSNSYLQEKDAIAELDLMIESYSKNDKSSSSIGKSKSRSKAHAESINMKNGGTWPKARSNVILNENPTGTIIQHPKRERPALSLFHENTPTKISPEQLPFCCQANNRNSNPIPISVQAPISNVLNRHSVYNSVDYPITSGIHFSKSGQLLCNQKSFTPTSAAFEKIDYENDGLNNRISTVSPQMDSMSDYSKGPNQMVFSPIKPPNSLELPSKNQMAGKDIQDYYGTKKSKNSKYSSDNESLGPDSLNPSLNSVSGVITSHSRIQSQVYSPITTSAAHRSGHNLLPSLPYHMGHVTTHKQQHTSRYPSPINVVQNSQSGESLGLSMSDRYSFEPPYSSACHTHGASIDQHTSRSKANRSGGFQKEEHLTYTHGYEGGTFPRKKENQRFRIPSNPSVTNSGGKVSTGSIERTSDHGSPMPTFHVEVLSPGSNSIDKHHSLPDYCWTQKPSPGELRRVHIDKSVEPLGIQIQCLDSGGVFVSTVTERSLASQVGLQIGDQLLEVCGINMRSATYQLAANVLRQCGNSITMLVQYSPDKYHELEGGIISSSSGGEGLSRSGSPTPRNSPRSGHGQAKQITSSDQQTSESSEGSRAQGQTLTRSQIAQAVTSLQRQSAMQTSRPQSQDQSANKSGQNQNETRFLFIETRKCSNLGISLVGGNAVGIFVHSVQADSLAHGAGLKTGDQILEYNGSDLRRATAEQAAYELAKPADKVTVLAHYNMDRYNEIKDKPGDSLYIRTGFDRLGDLGDSLQLRFSKDDVLYVDNTMFNGVPGHWRAWQLDSEGHRRQCGIIPSKYKVEEELMLRRSLGDIDNEARRGSTSARRSFFRRKKHQRSSSRDSKELASFSNITLGWYSDSGALNEECASYQRVERLDYPVFRPVLIIGPLADCVVDKLASDFPDKFKRCIPEVMRYNQSAMEKGVQDNVFVDFKKKGVYYECTTVAAVKDVCDKDTHCILDISVTAAERLHRQQIYPIILLIRFKSAKQIKEVNDARYPMDKVSAKVAKEMYEHGLKLETDYKHLISAVIPAGISIAYICTQIKAAVDTEQSKTLWVAQTS